MKIKEILKITSIPVVMASMCCLSPLILVMFGLGTAAFAGSLADFLYGEWKWLFRSIGLLLLVLSLVIYFRKQGICTLDQARSHRNKIINTILLSLIVAILGYIIFLYVVVHYPGVWLGLWE